MGLLNDVCGQFLGSSTMSKEHLLKAITTLPTLWDGSRIDRTRWIGCCAGWCRKADIGGDQR
ncbi:hypothetical protein PHLH4_20650 [Pseudomonas sp. St316]|nr:hypothetical protein PHLH4_20650 [Pseudomonas sp. St316]